MISLLDFCLNSEYEKRPFFKDLLGMTERYENENQKLFQEYRSSVFLKNNSSVLLKPEPSPVKPKEEFVLNSVPEMNYFKKKQSVTFVEEDPFKNTIQEDFVIDNEEEPLDENRYGSFAPHPEHRAQAFNPEPIESYPVEEEERVIEEIKPEPRNEEFPEKNLESNPFFEPGAQPHFHNKMTNFEPEENQIDNGLETPELFVESNGASLLSENQNPPKRAKTYNRIGIFDDSQDIYYRPNQKRNNEFVGLQKKEIIRNANHEQIDDKKVFDYETTNKGYIQASHM